MTFSDFDPPKENFKNEFPAMDTVVNVDNCWYYLSLLERFVEVTRNMPENILKLYLVRAEYRYFKWVKKVKDQVRKNDIPPLDVAFFWQTHMLSPLRFKEDCFRYPQFLPYEQLKISLKEIHEAAKDSHAAEAQWKSVMNSEPYNLTQEVLLDTASSSSAEVHCVVCYLKLCVEWEAYAEWRTDHTVAIQCHRCDTMFTTKHMGKANLIYDSGVLFKTAGLTFGIDKECVTNDNIQSLLTPAYRLKMQPFNKGIEPLSNYISVKQSQKGSAKNSNSTIIKDIIMDALQSTYLCTPYAESSIDMIQAVARQYKFAYRVTTSFNWDIPQGIIKGIRQYSSFISLIKSQPKLVAVPTIPIDLAWHTHMLHPNNYCSFTVKHLGKFLNHDDNVSEDRLEAHVIDTSDAWKQHTSKSNLMGKDIPATNKEKGFKIKLKSLVSKNNKKPIKIDGRDPTYEEYIFNGDYNSGSFQASPAYQFNENEVEVQDNEYDAYNISFHDRRESNEVINFNNSEALINRRFASVKNSNLGFIGTSSCAKNHPDASNNEKSTYNKVIRSFGNMPVITAKRIRELPAKQRYIYEANTSAEGISSREIRPNSTDGEFNWHIVSAVWINASPPKGAPNVSNCTIASSGCYGIISGAADVVSNF